MTRKVWAHWCFQSVCLAGALLLAFSAFAQTTAPPPAQTAEVITINAVLKVLGACVLALLGRWSWNQDKAIQRAQDTGDKAIDQVTDLRLEVRSMHQPKAEQAAAMEAALKPIQNELHHMRSEMAEMRKQTLAFSAQVIEALVSRKQDHA